MCDPDILINVAYGSAGTGKTTLALAYAADRYLKTGAKIQLTKPTAFVGDGKAFGPVPGDIEEKYAPYLESFYIVLKKIFGKDSKDYFEQMKKKGDLKFTPIAFARGTTYDNATFIIDEAQNLTWHELNSIVSRMGENTKCILLGDLKQIDIKLPYKETGMYQMLNTKIFQESPITSAIELASQYRSPITQLIAEVHDELRKE